MRALVRISRKRIREEENKLLALGSLFGNELPIEVPSSLPHTQSTFESMITVNTDIFEGSDEQEMIASDNEVDFEEDEFCLTLDISDDED